MIKNNRRIKLWSISSPDNYITILSQIPIFDKKKLQILKKILKKIKSSNKLSFGKS